MTTSGRMGRSQAGAAIGSGDRAYRALLESIYDGAVICDMDGRIVDVNPRAVEFLLFSRADLSEMSILDILSGAESSLIQTLIENLAEEISRRILEIPIVREVQIRVRKFPESLSGLISSVSVSFCRRKKS